MYRPLLLATALVFGVVHSGWAHDGTHCCTHHHQDSGSIGAQDYFSQAYAVIPVAQSHLETLPLSSKNTVPEKPYLRVDLSGKDCPTEAITIHQLYASWKSENSQYSNSSFLSWVDRNIYRAPSLKPGDKLTNYSVLLIQSAVREAVCTVQLSAIDTLPTPNDRCSEHCD